MNITLGQLNTKPDDISSSLNKVSIDFVPKASRFVALFFLNFILFSAFTKHGSIDSSVWGEKN